MKVLLAFAIATLSIISPTALSEHVATKDFGKLLRTYTGHTGLVLTLTKLPNGNLVSGSADSMIRIWNVTKDECEKTLVGQTGLVYSLATTTDGSLISGGEDKRVRVWSSDFYGFKCVLVDHTDRISNLVGLSASYLASGSWDGTIKIWNYRDCSLARTLPAGSGVHTLTLLKNGDLATGLFNGAVKLWNWKDGTLKRTVSLNASYWITGLVQLPNGHLAASVGPTIYIFDGVTGSVLKALSGHTLLVYQLIVLPDGRLASASEDKTIKLWDVGQGIHHYL